MNHSELDKLMLLFKEAKEKSKSYTLVGKLSGENIMSYTFEDISIPGSLDDSLFSSCKFKNIDFNGVYFTACKFRNCEFTSCKFRKADLIGVEFTNSKIYNSDLTAIDFNHGLIDSCKFENCCFSSSDITYSKVFGTCFRGYYYEKVSDLLLSNNESKNLLVEIEPVNLKELELKMQI